MKHLILAILLHLLLNGFLSGQTKDTPVQFWVSSGIGQSTSEAFSKSGVVGGLGFYIKARQHLFSAQVNQFWELPKDGLVLAEINEMKVQYGWIKTIEQKQFYIAGGVSSNTYSYYTTSTTSTEKQVFRKKKITVASNGLVLESGVNWVLNEHIGIGLTAFGNINNTALTAGYRVNILFGLFK